MRLFLLALLFASSLFATGCTASGGSPGAKVDDSEELVRPKAILTGTDGQTVSVKHLEVVLMLSTPVKHRRDELLFLVSAASDDHSLYRLDAIASIEFLEPGPTEAKFRHPVELTLRSGKVLKLLLFRFDQLKGFTLDEDAPFTRSVETLSRIDILNDASKE